MDEEADDDSKGDLHATEEFSRTKRQLLWTCSFALLLWLVHVSADGNVETPMLGSSVKIGLIPLQLSIWVACLYNFIGFLRQCRNIDRLNSKAIYTREFADIRERLRHLGGMFGAVIDMAHRTRTDLAKLNPSSVDQTNKVKEGLEEKLKDIMVALEATAEQFEEVPRPSVAQAF